MKEELLKRFLNAQCSPEEIEEIMHWINSGKFNSRISSLLKDKWDEPDIKKEPDFVYEQLLYSITNCIYKSEKDKKEVTGRQPLRKLNIDYSYYAKVAASITIFIAVIATSVVSFIKDQTNDHLPKITYVTKSTSIGEKLKFKLPDGSIITLNSASSLKYPDPFPKGKRDVFLNGEAFFDVKRDTISSFTVHNDKIATTALGTSFNIRAKNNEVKIALATGKVEVALKGNGEQEQYLMDLVPGEMATYKEGDVILGKEKFNMEEVAGWKSGQINFKQSSLNKVVERLEKWYGVTISLDPGISKEQKLTGKINNENLESIIQGICFSMDYEYNINGKNVEIKLK